MKMLNLAGMERKWQKAWEKARIFEAKDSSKKDKFYMLEMYPYPSAYGLHMGHAWNYTIGDIQARYWRMKGFNVLYPMGFDSFGLPAENAAIKAKSHPKKFTDEAIKNYVKQMKGIGLSYDWTRMIQSHKPEYYKWDQWIFLKMFEKGLAYRKKATVNFCKKCNTVLANEQVVNGRCWRHEDTEVEFKPLEQWFLKITDYADELVEGLDKLEWPKMIKDMQRNWIGKSEGTEVDFLVNGKAWKVFTTRVDTLFGVTFLVVSAQHPELMNLVTKDQEKKVLTFLKKVKSVSEKDQDKIDKGGVFTGSYAKHPLTGEDIPVWVGNFVVADYGSGMVMAVPAHDERDYEFAKKYKLKVKEVIESDKKREGAYTGYGTLVNSSGFDGLKSEEAVDKIANALSIKKLGKKKVAYRLRDWLISRQRFWGCPIPIIYCNDCGAVAVNEKDLPVKLPDKIKFEGVENPLKNNSGFLNAKCPKCGKPGRRETDTMDTFVDSSWYFLRYCDPGNSKEIFSKKKTDYWMPIDQYIGGKEHATSHLIYFRFFTKFMRDLGLLKVDEPAKRLFNQGVLFGPDGKRMSKSRGNVVLPEEASKKYGMDTARLFLISAASPDKDVTWSEKGVDGSLRFVMKVINHLKLWKPGKSGKRIEHYLNKGIKEIGEEIESFNYNLAVIKLRKVFEVLEEGCSKKDMQSFLKIFSLFCPHVAEELWQKVGKGFVSVAKWPDYDKRKIDDKLEMQEKAYEKVIEDIKKIKELSGVEKPKVYLYTIPGELKGYGERKKWIMESVGAKGVEVFAINDKNKHDPENKAGKAKLGRPGIYVE